MSEAGGKVETVRYGISPSLDAVLPRLAETLGWDGEAGLEIRTSMLAWGDVIPAIADGAVDVGIQNLNSFQASYEDIRKAGGDTVFYYPLFVFKGAAIMVRGDSGVRSLREMQEACPGPQPPIAETVAQLRGKTIQTVEGTEAEQLVLLALASAGLRPDDVRIVYDRPDENLAAFLRGDAQAFTGGVNDQLRSRREGHRQLLSAADLGFIVIDGLVTTTRYAREHDSTLRKLIDLWFRTIDYLEEDLQQRARIVVEELNRERSFPCDVDDYVYAWHHTDIHPNSPEETAELLLSLDSPYYWRRAWDRNNQCLLREGRIEQPVPYDAFWMEGAQPDP